jgi:hypothetical protein
MEGVQYEEVLRGSYVIQYTQKKMFVKGKEVSLLE